MPNTVEIKATIVIRKSSLRGDMAYEAIVVSNHDKRGTHANGTTPAEAARKAMGWHIHDNVRL